MAKSVRWAVETDEVILRALELRAHREGGNLSAVAEAVLRQGLAAELDELSGTVPLAAMIQTVIRQRSRTGSQATSRHPAAGSHPVTPRP
jgi:hypothetical protein